MANKIAVKVSGSIVASLFFEHVNSSGDQEGFLLGEFITRVTRTISDSHMSAEKDETSIHIYTIVPCDEPSFSFYDFSGKIQEEKLDYYVKGRRKDVIGWYKFRRNTPLDISIREQAVHENLCRTLAPGCHQFFLFGIFTSCETHDISTYTFDHIILRSTILGFERSSLNIINLGTTSHAEYLLHPHDATNVSAGCFSEAVNTIDVGKVASLNHILDMHRELRLRLESVKEDVASSEAIVGSVSLDVAELEAKIKAVQTLKDIEREQEKDYAEFRQPSVQEPVETLSEELLPVSLEVQDNLEQSHSGDILKKEEESTPVVQEDCGSGDNSSLENQMSCDPEGERNWEKETAT